MLNIVIPMAGEGSRFSAVGYDQPKPLISVIGRPMIQWVVENIKPRREHRFIFVIRREHEERFQITKILEELSPNSTYVFADSLTEGAAATVLLARSLINNSDQLMIVNSDQFLDFSIDKYLEHFDDEELDGFIMTMKSDEPKWSYILENNGRITNIFEKEVVSSEATVGVYNFRHGKDFVKYAEIMISFKQKVKNEYYVAPVYNNAIVDGLKFGFLNVGDDQKVMHGLGTPEDLARFIELKS